MIKVLIALVVTALSFADAPVIKRQTFQVEGRAIELALVKQRRLLISTECLGPKDELGACKALDAVKDASFKRYPVSRFGGAEPGASLCRVLGGRTVLAHDADGDAETLCGFEDGSLVATDSIHYHARKNDE